MMAHKASRGGSPLLILKLAQEYNRSPAICPVTFWTTTTHTWVWSIVSNLYKLVLSIPVSTSFWAAVGCVLKVRIIFRVFCCSFGVGFGGFFFNISFPNTDFLEPCLRTRQYNTRNPHPKMDLPRWCDMLEKSSSLRAEENFEPSSTLHKNGMVPGKNTSLAFHRPQPNTSYQLKQRPPLLKYVWHNKNRGSP